MTYRPFAVALALRLFTAVLALAQQPPTKRVRGSIESLDGAVMTVKTREGPSVPIRLADNVVVMAVSKLDIAAIQPNSYVGIASLKQPDGTMKALEVLVFPENARGAGEGHYPWDLQPESMMTNATVGTVTGSGSARVLELTYKDGKQTISVPEGVPIVTFAPADKTLLAKGTHVFVGGAAVAADGSLSAGRVLAGKDGLVPPM
jgi:hypothetical protein